MSMGGGYAGTGMGGYGGGGMGMGGMGGMPASNKPWQRPEEGREGTPIWLAGGEAHMKRIDENRAALAKSIEFNVSGMPLAHVAELLSEKAGVQIVLNRTELDLLGIDPDIPITLDSASSTVRELLRRVTSPLELSYVVYESVIEITSKDHAESHLAMRFYDLSYVLPNATSAMAVINAIQQTIHPDSWLANGGTSSIVLVGSMMVVAAPESTHQMIETFLINVARMNPTNAK
jgi:hypothetical protein